MSGRLAAWMACGAIWIGAATAALAQEAAPQPTQAALPPAAKLLPANTLFYIEIKDLKALQESIKKTGLYGLYTDPAMKEFVADAQKKVTEALDKWLADAWKSGGIENPPEKLPRPEGRIIVAMRLETIAKQAPNMEWSEADHALKQNGTRDVKQSQPQVFILADMGSYAATAKDLIKQGSEKSADKVQRSAETFHGLEVQVVTRNPAAAEEPKGAQAGGEMLPPLPNTTAWAWQGNTILVSSDVNFLKDVAGRLDSSDQESLADDNDFQKIARKLESEKADAWAYVGAKPLLELARNKIADSPDDGPQIEKAIKATGVDGLTGLGIAVALAPSPMEDSSFRFLLGVDGPPRGLLEVLSPPPMSTKPGALLTRDLSGFLVANCDVAKFYDTVMNIAQEISGQPVEEMLKGQLKAMAGEGNEPIDLRKDLMEQLAGPVTTVIRISKPYENAGSQQVVFSVALRDGAAVDKTIGKLFALAMGGMPTEMKKNLIRDMNGVSIYTIPVPGLMAAESPGEPAANPMAIAVAGQNLFMGKLESVRRCIRDSAKTPDPADSIAADPLFEQAARLLPAQAAAFSFSNEQIQTEFQWTMLKKVGLEEAKKAPEGAGDSARRRRASSVNPADMLAEAVKKYVDFTLLPDFPAVKKYFGAEVGFMTAGEEGIFGEFHNIKAPPSSEAASAPGN